MTPAQKRDRIAEIKKSKALAYREKRYYVLLQEQYEDRCKAMDQRVVQWLIEKDLMTADWEKAPTEIARLDKKVVQLDKERQRIDYAPKIAMLKKLRAQLAALEATV